MQASTTSGIRRYGRMVGGLLMLGLLAPAMSWACSTPVYRYALERWDADRYLLEVALPKEVPADLRAALDKLRVSEDTNVTVRTSPAKGDQGTLTLRYPHAPPTMAPAASLPATAANLALMVDSPARSEMAKRLIGGETAVLLFLESGDKEKDGKALERVQGIIGDMEKNLRLPAQAPIDTMIAGQEQAADLKIDFSVVRVRRNDPAERVLVETLLGTEPDLRDLDGPMVFPVFGRGRALYAIVDRGINAEVLYEAGAFVTGACSCQVKAQNPGVDLPMTADWDSVLEDIVYQEVELPPLTAITVGDGEATEDTQPAEDGEQAESAPSTCAGPGCDGMSATACGDAVGDMVELTDAENDGTVTVIAGTLAVLAILVLAGTLVLVARNQRKQ